jgi:hypothetical protein
MAISRLEFERLFESMPPDMATAMRVFKIRRSKMLDEWSQSDDLVFAFDQSNFRAIIMWGKVCGKAC